MRIKRIVSVICIVSLFYLPFAWANDLENELGTTTSFETQIIPLHKPIYLVHTVGQLTKQKPKSIAQVDTPAEVSEHSKKTKTQVVKADKNEVVFTEMVVTGNIEKDSHYTSPSTRVTREQIELQNAQTTEEVLKYQPSLQIRQRYVGDPNGVFGIRGADMFSTGRNMVFADGIPLHNHLQSTFNGAPRWSMVGPNEIDVVDVIYGPFSAEYSGNAIGGVVNIRTRMPQEQEFYVESSIFVQPGYNLHGPSKDTFIGDRQFFSYGNRINDFTVVGSYNRLEAEGHPQSYFIDNTGLQDTPGGVPVTGGVRINDARNTPSIIYGDTGQEKVNTHLFKGKLGYDITPGLQALFTAAYETRTRNQISSNNYLQDSSGQPFFGSRRPRDFTTPGIATLDGTRFDVDQSAFRSSRDERETLNLGLQLHGALTENWNIDTSVSHFNVLKDIRTRTNFSRNDPANNGTGRVQDFKQFDWLHANLKLSTPALLDNDKLSFLGGYHFTQQNLKFRQFDLVPFSNFSRGDLQSSRNNQGRATTQAMFGQSAYYFLPDWDVTAGVRLEWWSASNGVVSNTSVPTRNLFRTSPKVSVGYEPNNWRFRYSFGRAHRFPVIAELFQSLRDPNSILLANASLKPENGVHHNLMAEYEIPKGYIRMNFFRDDIKNDIQRITSLNGTLTTRATQNIDATSTTGVEFIITQQRVLKSPVDVMVNATWMNAKIDQAGLVAFTDSTGQNADFNLSGNQRIRSPKWRVNFFTTYHATPAWNLTLGGRYISDSFNDLDNRDRINDVFGTQSDFFFLDFKTNYRHQFSSGLKSRFSFGITNLNNDKGFVFHPYPLRTYLAEVALSY